MATKWLIADGNKAIRRIDSIHRTTEAVSTLRKKYKEQQNKEEV